jgi:hypothetical protein
MTIPLIFTAVKEFLIKISRIAAALICFFICCFFVTVEWLVLKSVRLIHLATQICELTQQSVDDGEFL